MIRNIMSVPYNFSHLPKSEAAKAILLITLTVSIIPRTIEFDNRTAASKIKLQRV